MPQVVLFTTKMGDTQTAAQQLRPIVREGMTIISFQNGVDGPEMIQPELRGAHVVPGVARIGSRIARPGVIEHMSPFARIEFGEASGGNSGKLERFRTICEAASIDAVLSNDIVRNVWGGSAHREHVRCSNANASIFLAPAVCFSKARRARSANASRLFGGHP